MLRRRMNKLHLSNNNSKLKDRDLEHFSLHQKKVQNLQVQNLHKQNLSTQNLVPQNL